MCGPLIAELHRADLDAGHQLRLLDRFLDRLDRRLEIDDDAALQALRLGDADADDVDAAVVEQLADHGADLGRADVETHHVPFLSCHSSSSPAYVLRLGRRVVFTAGAHTTVRRTASPRSRSPARRSRSAGARSRYCCSRATKSVSPSRSSAVIAVEDHDRVMQIDDVDLRDALGDLRPRRERADHARRKLGARARRSIEPPSLRRARARPSMIGRSMSAYDGPYSSTITPLRVDQIQRRADAADAHRAAFVHGDLDRRRQHAADRRALDPRRRQQPLLPFVEPRPSGCSARAGRRPAPALRRSTAARGRAPTCG